MPRYKEGLNSPISGDGDIGFLGFNSRDYPTQLRPGIAQFLQNQRCDNKVAQARKGIDRISDNIFVDNDPLTLNFTLGDCLSVSSITRSGTTATVTTSTDHGYATNDLINIEGANESDYNIEAAITITSATTFTYTVGGSPTTPATGTIESVKYPILDDPDDGVFASCIFSDVETNKEYIAQATLTKTILYDPDNISNTTEVFYPSGTAEEILEDIDIGSIIQVNNGLVLHRGIHKKALEWDGNLFNTLSNSITSVTRSGSTVTATSDVEHEYQTGDTIEISGATESDYNGQYSITITSPTVFTYTVSTTPTTPATGTIISQKIPQFKVRDDTRFNGFLSMPNAEYSIYHTLARQIVPVRVIDQSVESMTSASGIATATTPINHGLLIGDRIKISGASSVEFNGTFSITDTTANTFQYLVTGTPDLTDISSSIIVTQEVRDQFIVSDIYDNHTYDPVNNLFRIKRGGNDRLIGFLEYQNDNVIVLYRNSLNIVTGMSLASLEASSVYEITKEVGCIARKTAVVIGDNLMFFSEQGVYMIGITPELNLRGREIPLSESIDDDIKNINWDYADKAVAVYFNNRYYIALPAVGSTRNNIVFIYNLLNKEWESKDTFGGVDNYIDDFHIADKDGEKRLFATSSEGSIQLWEELNYDELGLDAGGSFTNTDISGQIITRQYYLNDQFNVKKFNGGSIDFEVLTGDEFSITSRTVNPDTSVASASYTGFTSDEDHFRNFRINKRGRAVEIQVDSTSGRPTIRQITIQGTTLHRSTKSFE